MNCIDCQHGGNKIFSSKNCVYICYNLKSIFWFNDVLGVSFKCEVFEPLIDIGERMELTYPIIEKNG